MPTELAPRVGEWYRRTDRPQPFQIVAVEYFDGTVDEWPLSHWYDLDIEESGEPPDASGALDDLEDEPATAGDGGGEDLRAKFRPDQGG